MLFATAVSDLSIVDALAEPRYRGVFVTLAREVLAAAPVPVEPFDGFDADDLDGSVDRLVEFNRRSAKTHSGIYRDLMVRKRQDREGDARGHRRPAAARTLELIGEIEDGRRTCEVANLELLAAYQRLQERAPALNAVIIELPPGRARRGRPAARSRRGGQGQHRRRGRRHDERVDGRRRRRRPSAMHPSSPPARRGRRPALQDEPARVRRRQRQPRVRDDLQPARPEPHLRRLEQRLGGARRGRRLRLRARHRHRRLDPHPRRLLRHRRPQADVRARAARGRLPALGELRPRRHAHRDRRADGDAARGAWPAGRSSCAPSTGLRVGVLRRQVDDPDLRPACASGCGRRSTRSAGRLRARRRRRARARPRRRGARGDRPARGLGRPPRRSTSARPTSTAPGTRALLELGARIVRRRLRQRARRQGARRGRLRARASRRSTCSPARRSPIAPPEDPPVGTPEGDLEGRYTAPVQPGGRSRRVRALRHRRGTPARGPAARRRRSATTPCCCRSPSNYEEVDPMRIEDCNWMQVERVPGARRPHRRAARLGRAARATCRSASTGSSRSACPTRRPSRSACS